MHTGAQINVAELIVHNDAIDIIVNSDIPCGKSSTTKDYILVEVSAKFWPARIARSLSCFRICVRLVIRVRESTNPFSMSRLWRVGGS